jgi:hypothetical protein
MANKSFLIRDILGGINAPELRVTDQNLAQNLGKSSTGTNPEYSSIFFEEHEFIYSYVHCYYL